MAKKITVDMIDKYCRREIRLWLKYARKGEAKNWSMEHKYDTLGRINGYIDIIFLIKAMKKGMTLDAYLKELSDEREAIRL